MNRRLFATDPPRRFFHLPERDWPEGALVLRDLRRRVLQVQPEAVAEYAVSEAEARELAKAEQQEVRQTISQMRERASIVMASLRAAAADVASIPTPEGPAPVEPGVLIDKLRPLLDALRADLDTLLDPATAQSEAGLNRLRQAAEALRARGGPDWTDNPAEIPTKIKTFLSDPNVADGLARLVQDLTTRVVG